MRFAICLLVLSSLAIRPANAETYIVSPDGTGDFPTIQAAVSGVQNGDMIELTDGTFTGLDNRNVNYLGKEITIRSQSGNPRACIIDCEGSSAPARRGFSFNHGEGPGAVLERVTVTGGVWNQADGGGAVLCGEGTSPTITHCIFSGNQAQTGGGVLCISASPVITDCVFFDNSANYGGGFQGCWESSPMLIRCTFDGNSAHSGGGAYI